MPGIKQREKYGIHNNAILHLIFSDDPMEIYRSASRIPWLMAAFILSMLFAVFHLILMLNPAVQYRMALHSVKGIEVTLPEAMASVAAWGWYGLIVLPLLLIPAFMGVAALLERFSCTERGTRDFGAHILLILTMSFIFLCGQVIGYVIICTGGLETLMDLRDLSPGVGLGLLPFFSLERIGPFFKEVVRGFDFFGIWLIFRGAAIYRSINGRSKLWNITFILLCYCFFIALRWVAEGPGFIGWNYFWSAGSGTI